MVAVLVSPLIDLEKGENTMGNGWKVGVAVVLLLLLCSMCMPEQSERNKVGSSIDWGDGYYWNSQNERVERTIWD